MEEKNEKGNNIVIGLLIVIIICLVITLIFVSYNKFIVKNESNTSNNNVFENEEKNNINNIGDTYLDLTNVSCSYTPANEEYSISESYGNCDKYNPKSLYTQYNLPNDHTIEKLIFANGRLVYLILSNMHENYRNEKYYEYLYSVENKNSYFINDNYKRIAGIYIKDNETKVILYNEDDYAEKFNFKTINLNNNNYNEFVYDEKKDSNVSGFTNPIIVSKNNKAYIVLTLASEYTDRLILTTNFKKIDIGLAYEGYELTEEGNIKIFVESHKYKIYDDAGNFISEGEY